MCQSLFLLRCLHLLLPRSHLLLPLLLQNHNHHQSHHQSYRQSPPLLPLFLLLWMPKNYEPTRPFLLSVEQIVKKEREKERKKKKKEKGRKERNEGTISPFWETNSNIRTSSSSYKGEEGVRGEKKVGEKKTNIHCLC